MEQMLPSEDEIALLNDTFSEAEKFFPDVSYTITEIIVCLFAIVGNALVITVFCKEKRLRRRTNYYIVSLATADLLVGLLGVPFALLASVGLPTNLHACLFTISSLVMLCTISILSLVAVSVDRYWAILYPLGYSRRVRTKTALIIISICWLTGWFIGFLPVMGWHQDVPTTTVCFFLKVMDPNFLVFLYFVTIITPAFLLAGFYAHIYTIVLQQLRHVVTINPGSDNDDPSTPPTPGGGMVRMLGPQQKKDVKATQNLSFIVLFFMICWIPLYTINFILAFCKNCFEVNSTFMLCCVILSHANSAGNPILYAYHLRDFRAALKNFLCGIFGIATTTNELTNVSNGRAPPASHKRQTYYDQQRFQPRSENALKRLNDSEHANLPTISSIVTQTAALAAAPTGDAGREIWRISENDSDDAREQQKNEKDFGGFVTKSYENILSVEASERSTENTMIDGEDAKAIDSSLSLSSPQLTCDFLLIEAGRSPEAQRQFLRSASEDEHCAR